MKGGSRSVVEKARTAVSTTISKAFGGMLSNGAISMHTDVQEYFREIAIEHPKMPRYEKFWDAAVLFRWLDACPAIPDARSDGVVNVPNWQNGEGSRETEEMPIETLRRARAIALLTLSTAGRSACLDKESAVRERCDRSDPEMIRLRLQFTKETRMARHGPQTSKWYSLRRDDSASDATDINAVLRNYLNVTAPQAAEMPAALKKEYGTPIFLSLNKNKGSRSRKSHTGLTSDAIAAVKRKLMRLMGVDTDYFKPHSWRGATAVSALKGGAPKEVVASNARWSNMKTFDKHYGGTTVDHKVDDESMLGFIQHSQIGLGRRAAPKRKKAWAPAKDANKPTKRSRKKPPRLPQGKKLVGAIVYKYFPTTKSGREFREFKGKVMKYDGGWYTLRYFEDGDTEIVDYNALCKPAYRWIYGSFHD